MSGERFLSPFSFLLYRAPLLFALLIPLCGLDIAHARHNSNKFDSALAYSQSSLYSKYKVLACLHVRDTGTPRCTGPRLHRRGCMNRARHPERGSSTRIV